MTPLFLSCALALPSAVMPMPQMAMAHQANGRIVAEFNHMLIRGVHAMNPGPTLMVHGPPDWVITLRRLSLQAWRVSRSRKTPWDVIAKQEHLPFREETFSVIYHEKYQPRTGADETALLAVHYVLAPMGFLIFDTHSHHHWERWLRMLDYFQLPFQWNGRQIFQKPARSA